MFLGFLLKLLDSDFFSKNYSFQANPWQKQMTGLELYYLLQEQIRDEEKSLDEFHVRYTEIEELLENLQNEFMSPVLKFSIFDPLRNDAARQLRLQRVSLPEFSK